MTKEECFNILDSIGVDIVREWLFMKSTPTVTRDYEQIEFKDYSSREQSVLESLLSDSELF